MTFSIPRTNVIESDAGFSVEILGPSGLIYREGARSMTVDSELLAGPPGLVIYSKSIGWSQLPLAKEEVQESERVRIVDNIRLAFKFRGFDIEIV